MSLRLIASPQPTNVVPLRPVQPDTTSEEPRAVLPHPATDWSSPFGADQLAASACAAWRAPEVGLFCRPAHQVAHGYLCFEEPDERQVATWTREITDVALRSGYKPGSIFMDGDASTGGLARGGFIELLAALRLPDAFGVVVPSLTHLSTDTFVQQTLVHMIQLTGSQLLMASSLNDTSSAAVQPIGSRNAS